MNSEIANLHAKLTADTSDAQRNLSDVRTKFVNAGIAAKDLGNELSGSISHFRAVGGSAQDFAQKLEHIRREALEAAEGVSKTSNEYARLQGIAARATTELNRNAAALNNVEGETRELQNQQRKAGTSTNMLGSAFNSLMPTLGAGMIAKAGLDFAVLAENTQKTTRALDGISGGQAAQSIAAISTALGGSVSNAQAATIAANLFATGVATSSEEAARFTEIAATLGSTMGQGVTQSVEGLRLAIDNIAYDRLGELGLSAGQVRIQVNELTAAGYSLNEAFELAVMEQATAKFNVLKDAGVEVGGSMDRVRAAAGNTAEAVGTLLVPALEAGSEGLAIMLNAITAEANQLWTEWGTIVTNTSEGVNWLAGQTLYAGQSMGWLTGALYNSNPAFASTYDWAVALTNETSDLQGGLAPLPKQLGAVGSGGYAAAGGLNAGAAAARNFKDAIDELNNRRTGNYGEARAHDTRYGLQEALAYREATRMGADEYFVPTPQSVIDNANWWLTHKDWTPDIAPVAPSGGGGGGGRSGGGGGPRAAGMTTGATAAREFAAGVGEGFKTQIEITDDAAIRAGVVDFIQDNLRLEEIRDELTRDLGQTMGATGAQVDLALTDMFGLRASPIDSLVDSMAVAADQNAAQLQEVGATVGRSIEEGLETRFNGIGDRIVGIVLEKLGEAA
jgi:hypothetical protein